MLRRFLSALLRGRFSRRNRINSLRSFRVEPLEERKLLTVSPSLLPATMIDDNSAGLGIRQNETASFQNPDFNQFFDFDGQFYFGANDGKNGPELWRYNSSTDKIEMVEDADDADITVPDGIAGTPGNFYGSNPQFLTNVKSSTSVSGTLYFSASDVTHGTELWRINNTTGRAEMVTNIRSDFQSFNPGQEYGSYPSNLTNVDGTLFFTATDATHGTELWRVNSSGQAEMVTDIATGLNYAGRPYGSNPQMLTAVGSTLYFVAYDGNQPGNHGQELWSANSTGPATLAADVEPGQSSANPNTLTAAGNTLFFTAFTQAEGTELWRITTGNAAEVVGGMAPGVDSSSPAVVNSTANLNHKKFTVLGNEIYFTAYNSAVGNELWKAGPTGQAQLIEDSIAGGGIYPGTNGPGVQNLTVGGGAVYFSANDKTHGEELWRINSTSGQAELVADVRPGALVISGPYGGTFPYGSRPAQITPFGGTVYFTANDGTNHGYELFKVETAGGVTPVIDRALSIFNPGYFTPGDTTMFFVGGSSAAGNELFAVDTAGTVYLVDNDGDGEGVRDGVSNNYGSPYPRGSFPNDKKLVNGVLFFKAFTDSAGGDGYEMWRVGQATPVSSSGPEIKVEHGASELQDATGNVDFGSKLVFGLTSETITITNTGTSNLTGLALNINGANAGDFSVSTLSTTTLAPSQSTTFTVNFSADGIGSRNAVLHIASNDSDESSFDIDLKGTGTGPALGLYDTFVGNSGGMPAAWSDAFFSDSNAASTVVESGSSVAVTDFRSSSGGGDGPQIIVSNNTFSAPSSTAGTITLKTQIASTSTSISDPNISAQSIIGVGNLAGNAIAMIIDASSGHVEAFVVQNAQPGGSLLPSNVTIPGYTGGPLTVTMSFDFDSVRIVAGGYDSGDVLYTTAGIAGFDSLGDLGTMGVVLGSSAEYHGMSSSADFTGTVVYDKVLLDVFSPPAPQIGVQGNGNSIASNDGSPSTTDDTFFGSTAVAGGSVSHTFTIANTGSATLNLTNSPLVSVSGANSADFTVTVQPSNAVAASGTTTFTVVFDPSGAGTRTATINIASNDADDGNYSFALQGVGTAVNSSPTTSGISNVNVKEDAANSVIDLTTSFADTEDGSAGLTYSIVNSSNVAIFTSASIASGQLTLDYAPDKNGSSNITIRATDSSGASVTSTFTVNVAAVNDAPSFTLSGDPPTVAQSAGAQSVSSFATGITSGPATATDEALQTVSFNVQVTGTTGGLTFSSPPAISSAGVLTYTIANGATGTATVSVTAVDSGNGTAPNVNTSAAQSFTITAALTTTRHFDFNNAISPTEAGFTGVPFTLYSAGLGYGWSGAAVSGFDRTTPAGTLRDANYGTAAAASTFSVDIPAGTYFVSFIMGDATGAMDNVNVNAEGGPVEFTGLSTASGQFIQRGFTVTVGGDNKLDLEIQDTGGAGGTKWNINQLDIKPTADVGTISLSGPGSVTPDGITIDTITGTTSLPNNSLVTVQTSLGTLVVSGDASTVYTGYQALVTGGTFSFKIQRPSGIGTPTITVQSVDGSVDTTVTSASVLAYPLPSLRRFDFNNAVSPTMSGYQGVQATTAYTAGSFGWRPAGSGIVLPAGGFDRPALPSSTHSADLLRDAMFGSGTAPSVFSVDVPDGTYFVSMTLGDFTGAMDQVQVNAESGPAELTNLSSASGQFIHSSFTVAVSGGTLDIEVRDLGGGAGLKWNVNSLEIRDARSAISITGGPGASAGADSGQTDTYSGSGATPNSIVTITSTMGTVTSDNHSLYTGTQAIADSSGNFTFTLKRPSVAGTATIAAEESTGAAFGTTTQSFVTAPVRKFDFNGTGVINNVGYTSVRGTDTYSAAAGFGWDATVTEFQRTGANNLRVDGHAGGGLQRTFTMTVNPSTQYTVRIYSGDQTTARVSQYQVQGASIYTANTAAGAYDIKEYTVTTGAAQTTMTVFVKSTSPNGWALNGIDIWETLTVIPGPNQQLVAAAPAPGSVAVPSITGAELQPIVAEAIARWAATGLSAAQLAVLKSTQVQVTNLGDSLELGHATPGRIQVDDNAAGWGWFVDSTPSDDTEFARGSSVAAGRMDLLTLVMHEFGHELGLDDVAASSQSLMSESLTAGTRRTPQAASTNSSSSNSSSAIARHRDLLFAAWR